MRHRDLDIFLTTKLVTSDFENKMIYNMNNAHRIIKHRAGSACPYEYLEQLESVLTTLWGLEVGQDYKWTWDNLKASNDPNRDDDQRHNHVRKPFDFWLLKWVSTRPEDQGYRSKYWAERHCNEALIKMQREARWKVQFSTPRWQWFALPTLTKADRIGSSS